MLSQKEIEVINALKENGVIIIKKYRDWNGKVVEEELDVDTILPKNWIRPNRCLGNKSLWVGLYNYGFVNVTKIDDILEYEI